MSMDYLTCLLVWIVASIVTAPLIGRWLRRRGTGA